MTQYVVISALGGDREGIVKDLSHIIFECGGNITESKMATLGGEFAVVMLVQGSDEVIANVEGKIPAMQESLNLTIQLKRTTAKASQPTKLPYQVEVVSMDHPGIVHDITDFFAVKGINIQEMDTSSYAAAHTGTPMFRLNMQVGIPSEITVSKLRTEFQEFCEGLNLDGNMEPSR